LNYQPRFFNFILSIFELINSINNIVIDKKSIIVW